MTRTVNVSTYIDVDIDLDDIDDDDLIDELKSRSLGSRVNLASTYEDITEMFYAFKLGHTERAMELAKKIAQDHTGRIL
jgi:hypothetical protein